MATLYLMVGIPGAGKTTYAKHHLAGAIRIGSDDIRRELFGKELTLRGYRNVHRILQRRAARCLANGRDVVIDCMNASVRARRIYFRLLPKGCSIVAIYLDTSLWRALQNNQKRSRHVPPIGIFWNWLRIRKPRKTEPFDMVRIVTKRHRKKGVRNVSERNSGK